MPEYSPYFKFGRRAQRWIDDPAKGCVDRPREPDAKMRGSTRGESSMTHARQAGPLLAIALGIAWLVPGTGRSESPPAPAPGTAPATLTVTARLADIPSKLPPDDLYDYAYVMRYVVIGGPLDKSSILVAHYKPLLPRSKITGKMKAHVAGKLRSFVQGDVHTLKLTADLKAIWKGPLIDEFAATDHKSVRYFCLAADPG
jgi:hypothetical protein